MLIDQERDVREKRERRLAAKAEAAIKKPVEVEDNEVMKKPKFQRRVRPRREYKAERRRARLAKYAPQSLSSETGDIDMADAGKKMTPVSKTLRLVKDKTSISK